MSPDPLAGSMRNPQSLNRYAYVQNNPVNLVDPLGLWCIFAGREWGYVCDSRSSAGVVSDFNQGRGQLFEGPGGLGGELGAGGGGFVAEIPTFDCQLKFHFDILVYVCSEASETFTLFGFGEGGGGGGGGKKKASPQQMQQRLADCIDDLYNIALRTFVPSAPGQNGNFFGQDAAGRVFNVENDVSRSSLRLGLSSGRLGRLGGLTERSNPYLNYTASDLPSSQYQFVQIHELAHSLDLITSDKSSEESADDLTDCVFSPRR